MKKIIIFGALVITIVVPAHASTLTETSPDFSDISVLTFSADYACAKYANICFYCGTSSSCPTGCTTYNPIPVGGHQTVGNTMIRCMNPTGVGNVRTCIAPGNGLLIKTDGNDSSTTYNFYSGIYLDFQHCQQNFTPSDCSAWGDGASSFQVINGRPVCKCEMVTQFCDICDAGYYLNTDYCARCPYMDDVNGVRRYGDSPQGSTSLSQCKMSTEYTFPDTNGNWQFLTACPAS